MVKVNVNTALLIEDKRSGHIEHTNVPFDRMNHS